MKVGSGVLYSATVTIGAYSGYLMAFDATSAPADGTVAPIWWFPVASNGTNGGATFGYAPGITFNVGCVLAFSTTGPFTKTASSTAAFCAQVR